jgi:site-specific recombinase XerD
MNITLIERHIWWLEHKKHRAPRTLIERRRILRHANLHLPKGIAYASDDEVAIYLHRWSKWTRHTYDTALRVFYGCCVAKGWLTIDPMIDIDKPKAGDRLPRPWDDDEIRIVLTQAPPFPWRRAAFLAVYAGLRCGEIATVQRSDIVRGRLRVRGKGDKVRMIPIADPLAEELDDGRTGNLCVGARGRPIQARTMSQHQAHAWVALGLRSDLHLHGARHAFATTLLEQGADCREIQVLMGHESLATTQNYLKVADRRTAAAVRLLPRWDVESGPADDRPGPTATNAA